jgi:hypothetical protein
VELKRISNICLCDAGVDSGSMMSLRLCMPSHFNTVQAILEFLVSKISHCAVLKTRKLFGFLEYRILYC